MNIQDSGRSDSLVGRRRAFSGASGFSGISGINGGNGLIIPAGLHSPETRERQKYLDLIPSEGTSSEDVTITKVQDFKQL